MDLEHPSITKTRLTGYPDNEKKALCREPIKNKTQPNYSINDFIEIYDEHRMNGHNQLESYTYASMTLAFSGGDVIQLRTLCFHYINDLSVDLEEILEVLK